MHRNIVLYLILNFLLSACTGLVQNGSGDAPVQDRGTVYPGGLPSPQGGSDKRTQAVSGLVQQADRYDQRGQYARSAAFLERALRISPRNAWLWHKLALVRMKQGYYAQAASMARKSLSLPGIPLRLKISNWELIQESAEKQGLQNVVMQARQKLLELRQQDE